MMKGVMFTQQGVTQIIDEDMPTIGDDQMLLRTRFSGISNGTERSFLMGGPYGGKKWPNRIGYLTVSEVIETGAQITDHAVGDIVYTGTYPGHVALHTARQSDLIIKVPEELGQAAATMLGLAGVSFFNTRRIEVSSHDQVLVTGAGGIGLMAIQSAKHFGAHVTVASRTDHRRELALRMGADAVVNLTGADAAEAESDLSCTALLECAGVELDPLLNPKCTPLSRFARVALVAGRERVDYNFLWASMRRIGFFQSTHFDQPTLQTVTELAQTGVLDLEGLISDVVPIDDAVAVYDRLRDDPMSVGGTVFDWT
ncbi:MAG: zinc-binding dehydrogenase [Gemmatimonadetes bacterium]|nr:zinc-binding dehydrogenase [Gemmatimonadota bacterium]MBT4611309.1 zinc-binding dehydrogenase [Gemmatimonadota bacterium]MBT5146382.1 zinc-binding dehydrogenase [Gemmatimonadota bacterium]